MWIIHGYSTKWLLFPRFFAAYPMNHYRFFMDLSWFSRIVADMGIFLRVRTSFTFHAYENRYTRIFETVNRWKTISSGTPPPPLRKKLPDSTSNNVFPHLTLDHGEWTHRFHCDTVYFFCTSVFPYVLWLFWKGQHEVRKIANLYKLVPVLG